MTGSWRNLLPAALGALLLLSAAPAAALEQAELKELEALLRDLGFDPGAVDGVVDDDTTAAIRRYQDFALLTGEPEPSAQLLNELRGVAAAFAALNGGQEEPPTAAPAPEIPEPGTGTAPPEEPAAPKAVPGPATDKVVVPPPPPPPKLKPLEAAEQAEAAAAPEAAQEPEVVQEPQPAQETDVTEETGVAEDTTSEEAAPAETQDQVATLPPAQAPGNEAPNKSAPRVPSSAEIRQMLGLGTPEAENPGAENPGAEIPEVEIPETETSAIDTPEAKPAPPDPAAQRRARLEAELAPYRADLDAGRITPQALARQFNDAGRQALQSADYETAVLKFSVAIELDPTFAGAYSNRGTAYQRQEEAELAAADFARAKELGFGGFRLRDGRDPFK